MLKTQFCMVFDFIFFNHQKKPKKTKKNSFENQIYKQETKYIEQNKTKTKQNKNIGFNQVPTVSVTQN